MKKSISSNLASRLGPCKRSTLQKHVVEASNKGNDSNLPKINYTPEYCQTSTQSEPKEKDDDVISLFADDDNQNDYIERGSELDNSSETTSVLCNETKKSVSLGNALLPKPVDCSHRKRQKFNSINRKPARKRNKPVPKLMSIKLSNPYNATNSKFKLSDPMTSSSVSADGFRKERPFMKHQAKISNRQNVPSQNSRICLRELEDKCRINDCTYSHDIMKFEHLFHWKLYINSNRFENIQDHYAHLHAIKEMDNQIFYFCLSKSLDFLFKSKKSSLIYTFVKEFMNVTTPNFWNQIIGYIYETYDPNILRCLILFRDYLDTYKPSNSCQMLMYLLDSIIANPDAVSYFPLMIRVVDYEFRWKTFSKYIVSVFEYVLKNESYLQVCGELITDHKFVIDNFSCINRGLLTNLASKFRSTNYVKEFELLDVFLKFQTKTLHSEEVQNLEKIYFDNYSYEWCVDNCPLRTRWFHLLIMEDKVNAISSHFSNENYSCILNILSKDLFSDKLIIKGCIMAIKKQLQLCDTVLEAWFAAMKKDNDKELLFMNNLIWILFMELKRNNNNTEASFILRLVINNKISFIREDPSVNKAIIAVEFLCQQDDFIGALCVLGLNEYGVPLPSNDPSVNRAQELQHFSIIVSLAHSLSAKNLLIQSDDLLMKAILTYKDKSYLWQEYALNISTIVNTILFKLILSENKEIKMRALKFWKLYFECLSSNKYFSIDLAMTVQRNLHNLAVNSMDWEVSYQLHFIGQMQGIYPCVKVNSTTIELIIFSYMSFEEILFCLCLLLRNIRRFIENFKDILLPDLSLDIIIQEIKFPNLDVKNFSEYPQEICDSSHVAAKLRLRKVLSQKLNPSITYMMQNDTFHIDNNSIYHYLREESAPVLS